MNMFHNPAAVRTVLAGLILGRGAVQCYVYSNEIKYRSLEITAHIWHIWVKRKTKSPSHSPSLYTTTINPSALLFSSGPHLIIVLDDGLRKGGTGDGAPVMTSQLRVVEASGPGCGALPLPSPSRLAPAVSQALNEDQTPHIRLRSPYGNLWRLVCVHV